MAWFGRIVQIGIRGIGSARGGEVEDARAYGADIVTAYEMRDIGMDAVLDRIPDGGPYYLTIDADGLDPTIMPAVMAQTPGGLDWAQTRKLIHGPRGQGAGLGHGPRGDRAPAAMSATSPRSTPNDCSATSSARPCAPATTGDRAP